ncbi:MAG: hypothetical protein R3352_06450 [Salinisphaeraceae bacterium]|nr:hypothetical protein [Salinisphaeraceae bacterium]
MSRLLQICLAMGLSFSTSTTQALETDWRGYLGYAGVSVDEDIDCETRACQGALASSLYYGLSLTVQGEDLGAQIVVSQDDEEDPELSIAQITARTGFGGVQIGARIGKIIVPLGLFGSQRITPTARPGLVQPQSFLLNTFYDFLTLSDKGLAVQINSESWTFKAAAYEPREEIIERVIQIPGDNPSTNVLQGIIALFLGTNPQPSQPTTITVTEEREFEGGYLGVGHQGLSTQTDLGFVRLDLNGSRLDAFNLGNIWLLGAWEPSFELIRLELEDTDTTIDGVSLNLTYNAEKWQAFANAVDIDIEDQNSREYVVGGAYYWNENWSGLLSLRQVEGDFSTVGSMELDKVQSATLSLGYSWN